MAVAFTIAQSGDGKTLTITDISTGISVTSRVLTIFDSNNELISTIDMGGGVTTTYIISKDVYLIFVLTLNTNQAATQNFLSTRFYDLAALPLEQQLDCDCKSTNQLCNDAIRALLCKSWASTYYTFGQGANSQRNIDAANRLINQPQKCNC